MLSIPPGSLPLPGLTFLVIRVGLQLPQLLSDQARSGSGHWYTPWPGPQKTYVKPESLLPSRASGAVGDQTLQVAS